MVNGLDDTEPLGHPGQPARAMISVRDSFFVFMNFIWYLAQPDQVQNFDHCCRARDQPRVRRDLSCLSRRTERKDRAPERRRKRGSDDSEKKKLMMSRSAIVSRSPLLLFSDSSIFSAQRRKSVAALFAPLRGLFISGFQGTEEEAFFHSCVPQIRIGNTCSKSEVSSQRLLFLYFFFLFLFSVTDEKRSKSADNALSFLSGKR